jgi:hypothetical protein
LSKAFDRVAIDTAKDLSAIGLDHFVELAPLGKTFIEKDILDRGVFALTEVTALDFASLLQSSFIENASFLADGDENFVDLFEALFG